MLNKKLLVSIVTAFVLLFAAQTALAAVQTANFNSLPYADEGVIPYGTALDGLVFTAVSDNKMEYRQHDGEGGTGGLIAHWEDHTVTWLAFHLESGANFSMKSLYYYNIYLATSGTAGKTYTFEGLRDGEVQYTMANVDVFNPLSGTITFTNWDNIDTLKISAVGESVHDVGAVFDNITYEAVTNSAPTDISLSNASIAENSATNATVGTFSTTDPNPTDTFTYSLVSGTGSTDNASFVIDGNTLKLNGVSLDYETKNSYSIRVRSTDNGTLYYEEAFTITVTDVDESTLIATASITGVVEPAAGATPQAVGSLTSGNATEYTVTSLIWQNSNGTPATLTGAGKFKAATTYQAEIKLTSATGYKFPSGGLTPTADGGTPEAGTVSGGNVTGNVLTFIVTFPATDALTVAGITVTSQPTKLSYVEGEALSLSGMLVTLTYNDGTTLTNIGPSSFAANGITTDPAASTTLTFVDHNGTTVEVACDIYSDYTTALTVAEPTYTVHANKDSLNFGSAVEGYSSAPAGQTVTITNTGNSACTLTLPTNTYYDILTSDSLTLAPAGSATFSVRPKTGLAEGDYGDMIYFETDQFTDDSVAVSFTVDAPTYTLTASESVLNFGSAVEGYASAPAGQTVTITNTGNSSFTLTLPTSTYYDVSTSDSLALAPSGTATFSVRPKTGLTEGIYTDFILFETDHAADVSVDARFTVDAADYTLEANAVSLDFGIEVVGYAAAPSAQTVVLTNAGNASFTLTLPTSTNFTVTTPDPLTLAPSGTATVSIRPKTGLSVGLYGDLLTFQTNHSTDVSVDVTFEVEANAYTVEADAVSLAFGSKVAGYASAPLAQTVVLTNTGNSDFTLTLPTSTDYDVTTSDSLTLASGDTASVSVRPKTGLAAGAHNETLTFQTNHSTSDSVDVTFTVDTNTYTVEADQTSLAFGSKVEGYLTAPLAQTVVLTNTGNSEFTLTLPTSTDYDVTSADSLTLAPSGTAIVSVRPKTGLAAGAHNETLTFQTNHSTSDSVDAAFTVDTATYTVSANKDSLPFGSAVEGYDPAPAGQTVVLTNAGNSAFTLTLPTSTDYDVTTSDSLTLAPSATATVTVRPKTGLAAGAHNETLTFQTNHSTSDSVDVTFSVDAAVYTLTADPTSIDFGSQTVGYGPVAAQTVTITNTGNLISTLVQPTGIDYTVGALSRTVLNPGDTATYTVNPKDGFAVGTYAETISVEGTGSAEAGTDVTFEVLPINYGVTGDTTFYQSSPNGLVFTSNGSFQDFTGVTVDGVPLNNTQYGAQEGSTIITLYNRYLDTLPLGSHTMLIQFRDGYSSADFEVRPLYSPNTGDGTPVALYALLLLLSLSGLILLARKPFRR